MSNEIKKNVLSESFPVIYNFINRDYRYPIMEDNACHLEILERFIKGYNNSPNEIETARSFFNMIITTKSMHGEWVQISATEHIKK